MRMMKSFIFDPSYDSYAPSVALVGGKAVHIALQAPHFSGRLGAGQRAIHGQNQTDHYQHAT